MGVAAIVGRVDCPSSYADTNDEDGDGNTTETLYVNNKVIIKNCYVNLDEDNFVSVNEGTSVAGQHVCHGGVVGVAGSNALDVKMSDIVKEIENELEKDEIMELYMNVIFMGQNLYGVRSASLAYFNKDVLQGYISVDDAKVYNMLNNKLKNIKENGILSFYIFDSSRFTSNYNNNCHHFKAKIKLYTTNAADTLCGSSDC